MAVPSLLSWCVRCTRAVLTTLLSLILLLGTLPAAPPVQAAPGDLDPTFGDDGIVTTPIGPDSATDEARAVAVQADGKILVAGSAEMGDTRRDFALARYNPDGSLDTSFSGDGIVTTSIDSGSFNDAAYTLAVQADGKILVAGFALMEGTRYDFALVRYNEDGSLDTEFGDDGIVTTSIDSGNGADVAYAVAVQADGKILVAGTAAMGGPRG